MRGRQKALATLLDGWTTLWAWRRSSRCCARWSTASSCGRRRPGRHPSVKVVAYADGASRGNPGPSSYGAVVYDSDGNELHETSVRRSATHEQRGGVPRRDRGAGGGARPGRERDRAADGLGAGRATADRRYKVRTPGLLPLHKRVLELRALRARVGRPRAARAEQARRPARERGAGWRASAT